MATLTSAYRRRFLQSALCCFTASTVPAFGTCFVFSKSICSSSLQISSLSRIPPYRRNAFALSPSTSAVSRLFMSTNAVTGGDSVVASVERKIRKELNPVQLEVIPAYGDPNGSHVTIKVVSDAFEGKRPLQRQQMVYKIIWEEMQGAIHAVDQMVVKTPKEAGL